MTTTKSPPTDVVVVDGSNIATEGRSMPSLKQLVEAVNAFRAEYPDATVTVVVDATFGHRIDKSEVAEFDEAIAHNELVAPPAGAIGRGDAFVLSIANKVGARILTNDSFQEFHGQYPWLFDEGRLIGGKPVPHVGWVFVERLPVKGPTSRKAQKAAKAAKEPKAVRRQASKEASRPMPVPTAPPPGSRPARAAHPEPNGAEPAAKGAPAKSDAPPAGPVVNELLPFLEFVEKHPVGSSVNGVVESYSSHGAYVTVDNVRGYVPLRLMSDPPPRSAREVMRIGDAVTLVVVNFVPARRSIDLAVPAMAPGAAVQPPPELEVLAEAAGAASGKGRRGRREKAAARPPKEQVVAAAVEEAAAEIASEAPPAEPELVPAATSDGAGPAPAEGHARGRKRTPKKAAADKKAGGRRAQAEEAPVAETPPPPERDAEPVELPADVPPAAGKARGRKAAAKAAADTTAKKAAARPARKKAVAPPAPPIEMPAEPPPAEQPGTGEAHPAKRAAAKKAAAKKAEAEKAPARKAAAKKAAADKVPAKKTPTKKVAAPEAPAKKVAAKKAAAGTAPAKKGPAKKAATKQAPAKKAAEKTAAKTAPARKAAGRQVSAGPAAGGMAVDGMPVEQRPAGGRSRRRAAT